MKKDNIFVILFTVIVCAMAFGLSSCNGSHGTNLPTDGIFGELPSAADYEKQLVDALESAVTSSGNGNEINRIWESKSKEIDSLINAGVMAEAQKLKDKDFPTEITQEIPWKIVVPFRLNLEKSENNTLYFIAEVENTDKNDVSGFGVILVDKNGAPLFAIKHDKYYDSEGYANSADMGAKGKFEARIDVTPWNAKLLSKADKFLITRSWYPNDKLYEEAKDSTSSAEKAYKKKLDDIMMRKLEKVLK